MKGVKLPEPVAWMTDRKMGQKRPLLDWPDIATNADYVRVHSEWLWRPIYTESQMLSIYEQGRLEGMEEALDSIASNGCESAGDCVVVIRALAAPGAGKEWDGE